MYLNFEITNKISHHAHRVHNILTKTPRQTPHCDKNHTIPPSEYVNSCYKVYINKTVAGTMFRAAKTSVNNLSSINGKQINADKQ